MINYQIVDKLWAQMSTRCLFSNVVHGAMIIIEIIGCWGLGIQDLVTWWPLEPITLNCLTWGKGFGIHYLVTNLCFPVISSWGWGSDFEFLMENFGFAFEHLKIPPHLTIIRIFHGELEIWAPQNTPHPTQLRLLMQNWDSVALWKLHCVPSCSYCHANRW